MHDASSILHRYLAVFPSEFTRQQRLRDFLESTPLPLQADRKNAAGHLTASGIVFDRTGQRILLVHHVGLDRWLQPGGHIEPGDATLARAALREIEEETGINPADLTLLDATGKLASAADADVLPIDVDSHDIPARPSRSEPAHVHYDFRFAFIASEGALPRIGDRSEVHAVQWREVSEVTADDDLHQVVVKMVRLIASLAHLVPSPGTPEEG